ncbi:hypothetical protein SAMN02745166_01967 [Prosthecobacter debontii]|uniref:Uncharacterized protein n=1 Tax=Prosthecobacter debontii TaxID=48467 RepID=A0A1T4XTB3_9BACT|nr:hypothetical protein [Prosthecobacter debontii]SKA92799.1 hypothetical protein SAMN02745166_01967 [Prosthecobacter debontii]
MYIKLLVQCVFVSGAVGFAFVVLSFLAFDSALRKLAQHHPERWIKLGKPIGFFWQPKMPFKTVSGSVARTNLYNQWIHRPLIDLVAEDLPINELTRMRRFSRISTFSSAGFLALLLASIAVVLIS